ncbi:glycosyltransferase 87 family protein [Hyalangium rubrum]|uniref:Glycosyltransferase 87 family protein n=1 Tax=Hyalangium rubrum TaxID=3103134 RepID=A0ABU5H695_9BACT|nr:glycosyltransferase 87 family protein [Hyalangium sp. s54d21]MDY7228978.1 glycosyltransferase 87 family protein [Hyalangium sp. s54d21]
MERKTWSGAPWLWLALGVLGVAVRLGLWWGTFGSNDSYIWAIHGQRVFQLGLTRTYELFSDFNHPPLMGLYARWAWSVTGELLANNTLNLETVGNAGELMGFARLMKLPGLLGEALVLWALWRFASPRAFAAYALLPAPILVSSYHGNTDCLYAAFVLLAALMFDQRRYFLSGLLWSAALNVKLLPLALLPIVLLAPRDWRAFLRLVAGGVLGLLPFLPPALTVAASMYRNMLTYNSRPDNWGLMAFLNLSLEIPNLSPFFWPVRTWFLEAGRYLVLGSITAVALLSRFRSGMTMAQQAAVGSALFFVLAPGFGVQYVVLAAPLLCFVDLRAGLRWGWASGLFIGLVYWIYLRTLSPPLSYFTVFFPGPAPVVGILAWAVLGHFAWTHLWTAWRRREVSLSVQPGSEAVTAPRPAA